jgi:hypothetical protein
MALSLAFLIADVRYYPDPDHPQNVRIVLTIAIAHYPSCNVYRFFHQTRRLFFGLFSHRYPGGSGGIYAASGEGISEDRSDRYSFSGSTFLSGCIFRFTSIGIRPQCLQQNWVNYAHWSVYQKLNSHR